MAKQWRQMVKNLPPEEKKRIVAALGIDASTFTRWGSGIQSPKVVHIRQLADLIPELRLALREEFAYVFEAPDDPTHLQIPSTYATAIAGMLARTSEHVVFYTISNHVFEDILSQFDPAEDGMMVLFVQCVLPNDPAEKIRALSVEGSGAGTGPWKRGQIQRPFTLGEASLSGVCVRTLRPAFYPQDNSFLRSAPVLHIDKIESVGAFPVMRWGKLAGVLFFASVYEHFFTAVRRKLAQEYSNFFALALKDELFVNPERIALRVIPSPPHQKILLETFHGYMEAIGKEPANQSLSLDELEQLAVQRIQERVKEPMYD